MIQMAAHGAKILHLRCVESARRHILPIHVRSSFSGREGTWVADDAIDLSVKPGIIPTDEVTEGEAVEQPIITGITHERDEAKNTVAGSPAAAAKAPHIAQIDTPAQQTP